MGYVLQAAKGQYELISESIPVDEALEKGTLSEDEKTRIQMVERVKAFGEEMLGLSVTDNYTTVYLKSPQHAVYTISASPKDRLTRITWWFPIVGRMPYLGFFDRNKAAMEAEALKKKDLDVALGEAKAYSTLGWFKDPLTKELLKGSAIDLVDTILHEMTHTTIYLKGQGEFNEGLAVLVGRWGAAKFMEFEYGFDHVLTHQARAAIGDERVFSRFLNAVIDDLDSLYLSSLSYQEKLDGRERVFAEAKTAFETIAPCLHTNDFDYFKRLPLNNAVLMAIGLYHRYFDLFEAVLREHRYNIKETIRFLKQLSRENEQTLPAVKQWLVDQKVFIQPSSECGSFTSVSDPSW
jgi:predicted aminopeptidase